MNTDELSEQLVRDLLCVLPSWHSKLVRPLKDLLNKEMSLETYYCLETLKQYGTISMTELAQQLKVPKQQVTKLVDTLCGHRFVERVYDEADRRVIWVRLTPRAERYLDESYLKNTAFIQALRDRLTDEELRKLSGAVEDLQEILPKLR